MGNKSDAELHEIVLLRAPDINTTVSPRDAPNWLAHITMSSILKVRRTSCI